MGIYLLVLMQLLAATCLAAGPQKIANGVLLFPAAGGKHFLEPCTGIKRKVSGFFDPAVSDVTLADQRVTMELTAIQKKGRLSYEPAQYTRQYIGAKIGDEEFIYLIAVAYDSEDLPKVTDSPIRLCGGGQKAFTAFYSLKTKKLSPLNFNGPR
jgi:hypothetical protein